MPPIIRTESLHSWWSDSNLPGATIPLHTLAKPLSKFLHRRQLSGIISQGRGRPISTDTLEALMSYLEATEIPSSTKLSILEDLTARAQVEAQAQTMGQGYALGVLVRLLHSPEVKIVESACTLLGNLSLWEDVNATIAVLNPCSHLIYLATRSDAEARKPSSYALSCISRWEAGVQAMAEANPHELVAQLFQSDDADDLQRACRMLGGLFRFGTVSTIANFRTYMRLDSFEEHPESSVQDAALYALTCIDDASKDKGVDDMITSFTTYSRLVKILEYATPSCPEETLRLVISSSPYHSVSHLLLFVFNSPNPILVNSAMNVFEYLSDSESGARALSTSDFYQQVEHLLDLRNPTILASTCRILANMSRSNELRPAIIDLDLNGRMTSLFRSHPDQYVQAGAMYALFRIYYHPAGEYNKTDILAILLDSADSTIVEGACKFLAPMVRNSTLHEEIVQSGCCPPLVRALKYHFTAIPELCFLIYFSTDNNLTHFGSARASANLKWERALYATHTYSTTSLHCCSLLLVMSWKVSATSSAMLPAGRLSAKLWSARRQQLSPYIYSVQDAAENVLQLITGVSQTWWGLTLQGTEEDAAEYVLRHITAYQLISGPEETAEYILPYIHRGFKRNLDSVQETREEEREDHIFRDRHITVTLPPEYLDNFSRTLRDLY
ncbi:armadillo-type protein [Mycena vulgaris]|nr:armadillo-type protein [Mycena vulgaris]